MSPAARATVFFRCAPTASCPGERQRDGKRGIAAGPAEDQFPAEEHAHDGIVHVAGDGAIVHKKKVRDAAEPVESLPFIGADRFVTAVAAGCHHREVDPEEELMQGRVRQHHAQRRISGSDASQTRDDPHRDAGEERWVLQGNAGGAPPVGTAQRADLFQGRDHHRQGLLFAVFVLAQPADRRDRRRRPPEDETRRCPLTATISPARIRWTVAAIALVPIVEQLSVAVQHPELRSAVRAGIGLGMEAAVAADRRTRPARGAHRTNRRMVVFGRS